MDVFAATKQTLVTVLHLSDNIDNKNKDTQLLGSFPELDSMAVVNVITALEEQFGIIFDDEEITAEMFETMGSLSDAVERKIKLG